MRFGRAVVETFGEPDAEYVQLTETVGLVAGTDRGILEVAGERATRMLAGLVTNDLSPMAKGTGVYAFVLTPKGRPVAELRLIPHPETMWLDAPAACLTPLLNHLERYIPPLYARVRLVEEVVRLSVVGPRAVEAMDRMRESAPWARRLPALDSLIPLGTVALDSLSSPEGDAIAEEPGDDDEGGQRSGPWLLVRRETVDGDGFDLYLPAEALNPLWRSLRQAVAAEGGGPVGYRASDCRRVERGVPAYGYDITLDNLPQETGQEDRAISYTKGCYTGQEVVARIHYRGRVNHLLRGLVFSGPLPEAGRQLYREDRPVGRVTSPVHSPQLGPIALGYVRREVELGERLSLEPGGPPVVRVDPLPFTST